MPRLTVTITEEQEELLEELSSDSGEYESKSEAVRNLIQRGERVDELEQKVERLEREKRMLVEQREEHTELVEYVDEERSWRSAPLTKRVRWWLFGKGDD